MSSTLSIPLGEQEHLKEFFELFRENPQAEQKLDDIEQLLSYIQDLKTQLGDAYEEIHYIKDVMESMQDKTLKAKLEKCVVAAGKQLEVAKETYQNLKGKVCQDIKQAAQNAKLQGIKVIDKAVDVLHVRKALESIKNCLEKAVTSLGNGMQRLELAQQEVNEIKSHFGNLGRTMTCKGEDVSQRSNHDENETTRNNGKGVLLSLHKALFFCKRQVEGMEKRTVSAIGSVEHLHQLTVLDNQRTDLENGKEKMPELQIQKSR